MYFVNIKNGAFTGVYSTTFKENVPESTFEVENLPPDKFHNKLIDGKWVFNDELITELKTLKLNEINDIYEQKALVVKIDTPESEVSTWYIQETEATEWSKDNTKPTPFIDGLADSRQVDRLELIDKILTKVNAYKTFMGNLTGQRQYYEDAIKSAKTQKEIEDINWV